MNSSSLLLQVNMSLFMNHLRCTEPARVHAKSWFGQDPIQYQYTLKLITTLDKTEHWNWNFHLSNMCRVIHNYHSFHNLSAMDAMDLLTQMSSWDFIWICDFIWIWDGIGFIMKNEMRFWTFLVSLHWNEIWDEIWV